MNTAEVLQFLFPNVDPMRSWSVNGASMEIEGWSLDVKQPSVETIRDTFDGAAFKAWKQKRMQNAVDQQTARSINGAIHPFTPIAEQIGILRDQIARMLNGDMTASEGFARLNSIAIAEIMKAHLEKEAL